MLNNRFGNKRPLEKLVLAFEFGDELDPGEALQTVSATSVMTLSGVDATPESLLNGVAAIVGTDVLLPVKNGVAGCEYALEVVVSTSNANKVLARVGRLYVEP
jgi:hypothetical protein